MENLDDSKKWLARNTNPNKLSGTLLDATKDTDLVIGVSGPGIIPVEAIEKMAENPIVFALANPVPEIMPEEILGIARIIATGDRKSTRLNSSHVAISYAVFCLKKKKNNQK